jgi:hypothetical protein
MQVATNSFEAATLIANAMVDPSIRLEVKDGVIQTAKDKKNAWTDAEAQEVVHAYLTMAHAETQSIPETFQDIAIKLDIPQRDYQLVIHNLTQGLLATGDKANQIENGLEALHAVQSALPKAVQNYQDLQIQAKLAECRNIVNSFDKKDASVVNTKNLWTLINFFVELDDRQADIISGTLTLFPDWHTHAFENAKSLSPRDKAEIVSDITARMRQYIFAFYQQINGGESFDPNELDILLHQAQKD